MMQEILNCSFFFFGSDVFIHNVCSSQAITSAWGTLQTPNFPNPYTSSDDCWCKLSTQLQHRLLLSIIVFQLIPYDRSSLIQRKKKFFFSFYFDLSRKMCWSWALYTE
jgi:hypothetical protein